MFKAASAGASAFERSVDDCASPITLSKARKAYGHALAGRRRNHQRRLLRRALEPRHLLLQLLRRHRVGLVERHDLRLVGEPFAIGVELRPHGLVGLARMLAGAVDQMQQHAAALDMAEEAVAQPRALVRALDQAGNVGEHETAAVDVDHAELRMQRGEGIVRDLRLVPRSPPRGTSICRRWAGRPRRRRRSASAAAGWCAPRPAGRDWHGAARDWSSS